MTSLKIDLTLGHKPHRFPNQISANHPKTLLNQQKLSELRWAFKRKFWIATIVQARNAKAQISPSHRSRNGSKSSFVSFLIIINLTDVVNFVSIRFIGFQSFYIDYTIMSVWNIHFRIFLDFLWLLESEKYFKSLGFLSLFSGIYGSLQNGFSVIFLLLIFCLLNMYRAHKFCTGSPVFFLNSAAYLVFFVAWIMAIFEISVVASGHCSNKKCSLFCHLCLIRSTGLTKFVICLEFLASIFCRISGFLNLRFYKEFVTSNIACEHTFYTFWSFLVCSFKKSSYGFLC